MQHFLHSDSVSLNEQSGSASPQEAAQKVLTCNKNYVDMLLILFTMLLKRIWSSNCCLEDRTLHLWYIKRNYVVQKS